MPPRSTHDYPGGKPLPIALVEIAFGVVGLFWILAPITWARAAAFGALFLALVWIRWELLRKYEGLGRAVPRPQRRRIVFPNGMPTPLRVMRYAVFVPMIAMLAFGKATFPIARIGMIVCVLILFVMGLVYIGLQVVYVNTGRAQEVSAKPDASLTPRPGSTR